MRSEFQQPLPFVVMRHEDVEQPILRIVSALLRFGSCPVRSTETDLPAPMWRVQYRPRWMLTREFRKLWLGQAISAVGSAVTILALPLTAALTLGATPEQMGVLTAVGWPPYLLFALFAGAWADRLPRKPILVATDLARAAVLVTIPLAAFAGMLRIEHVLAVAFVAGSMTVLFRSAYGPFIPVLVGRDALVEANAKLALTESVARVVGPSLGGLLVQVITAPLAILIDALSFVVSAIAVASVRVRETPPPRAARRSIWSEIAEGMRVLLANPFTRSVTVIGLLFNAAITIGDAIFILYLTRELGLDGALIGSSTWSGAFRPSPARRSCRERPRAFASDRRWSVRSCSSLSPAFWSSRRADRPSSRLPTLPCVERSSASAPRCSTSPRLRSGRARSPTGCSDA